MHNTQAKSPAMVIVLSIVTCGIYGLIWKVTTHNAVEELSDESNPTDGVVVILLSIVTCGIYALYWWYKVGQKMAVVGQKKNVAIADNAVLYLVLAILGLSIVNMAIVQSDLNRALTNKDFLSDF